MVGEGEDIGGLVFAKVDTVQVLDATVVHAHHAHVEISHPQGVKEKAAVHSQQGIVEPHLPLMVLEPHTLHCLELPFNVVSESIRTTSSQTTHVVYSSLLEMERRRGECIVSSAFISWQRYRRLYYVENSLI